MNEWDAPDNTKTINLKHKVCEICGERQQCVSDSGTEEHGRAGEHICNHCFDIISEQTNCNGTSSSCTSCQHAECNQPY